LQRKRARKEGRKEGKKGGKKEGKKKEREGGRKEGEKSEAQILSILRAERDKYVMVMKNGVFWDVKPCGYCKNRIFGGT
jgi:hypothetical protein